MNQTPRKLNHILLALFGALLMLAGALAVVLAAVPAARGWWGELARAVEARLDALFTATTLPGQKDSWLWIVITLLLIAVIVLMVAWVAAQGKGRTGDLVTDYDDDDGVPGAISLSAGVAEHALKTALQERPDIVHAAVATYDFQGSRALKIRVLPRQGVPPYRVADDVSVLVEAMDLVVGSESPVLISIGPARARLVRPDRVR